LVLESDILNLIKGYSSEPSFVAVIFNTCDFYSILFVILRSLRVTFLVYSTSTFTERTSVSPICSYIFFNIFFDPSVPSMLKACPSLSIIKRLYSLVTVPVTGSIKLSAAAVDHWRKRDMAEALRYSRRPVRRLANRRGWAW